MLKKVLMEEMTGPEFQEALQETDTAILPLGSTEALGNHGPLGADFLVASLVARRLGEEAQCLVTPTVPVGDTLELSHLPGTLSVGFDTLKAFYLDLCSCLVRHGIKRIFVLNAHLGNMRAIDYCGRMLRRQGVAAAQADWWRVAFAAAADLVESVHPYAHGGEVITSVLLALRPELVDLSQAVDEESREELAFHLQHTATSGGPFYTYPDFRDFCAGGGWGEPRFASADKGRKIVERAVERILGFLREFKGQPLPET